MDPSGKSFAPSCFGKYKILGLRLMVNPSLCSRAEAGFSLTLRPSMIMFEASLNILLLDKETSSSFVRYEYQIIVNNSSR